MLIFKWWRAIIIIILILPLPELPRWYGHFAKEGVLDVIILVVIVVIVAGVSKGCSIDGGTDGSSVPFADSLRHRLSQRGEDEGDLNGGKSTGNGWGRGSLIQAAPDGGQLTNFPPLVRREMAAYPTTPDAGTDATR